MRFKEQLSMSDGEKKGPDHGQIALEHLSALYGYAMSLTRDETYCRRPRAGNLCACSARL